MNKYHPHLYIIPEDDANRQIAIGFRDHTHVDDRRIQVMRVAGGWTNVLNTFRDEYVSILRRYAKAHVVMLVDFDNLFDSRFSEVTDQIPEELRVRAFVLGTKTNPEELRRELGLKFDFIGRRLADDCFNETTDHWNHDHLRHNDAERVRLLTTVRPFLFP